jgi:glucose-6-phosphate 1-epimerase
VEIIDLISAHGTARIASKGAHLMSVRLAGRELLWLSDQAETQATTPGTAVRGGVPVCFPWFGTDPQGRPAHGFARTVEWRLAERSADRAVFALDDDGASRALWPHRFHAELAVRLDDAVHIMFTVANTDETPFTFTYALHSYFAVDAARPVEVDALVTVNGHLDEIYQNVPDLLTVRDAGGRIDVDARNMTSAVVWNPGPNTMPDVGERWREFVCVERGRVGAAAVTVAPGGTYQASLRGRRERREV